MAVQKLVTQLSDYLTRKRIEYTIFNFPVIFNNFGCLATHENNLINQFILSYLSVFNHYFADNCLYLIYPSFHQFFFQDKQLLYIYASLKQYIPEYQMIILSENINKYKTNNQLLNIPSLYLSINELSLLDILYFMKI